MTFKPTANKPCQYSLNNINWFDCDVLFASDEHLIIRTYPTGFPAGKASEELVVDIEAESYTLANDYSQSIVFREPVKELSVQEQLMEAWTGQGIDYTHDTEQDVWQLGDIFDFVARNFKLEKK